MRRTERRAQLAARGALLALCATCLLACVGPGLEPPDKGGANAGVDTPIGSPDHGARDGGSGAGAAEPPPVSPPETSQGGAGGRGDAQDAGGAIDGDLDGGAPEDASADDGGAADELQ